jgi:hypothetical protein
MTIELDYAFIDRLLAMSGPEIFWYFLIHGGWILLLIVLLWGFYKIYIQRQEIKNIATHEYILLAIDVPKDNIQTPKAVEHIFAHLAGAHSSPTRREQYWFGTVQPWFSLEIASIEGYIQYFIRTPAKFRDLVEASIYAQYPDAEITEVEDYTYLVPVKKFPDPEWDMWGCDFIQVKDQAYPIRTYPEFEHGLTQEFKDPLAAILENLTLLGPGEHFWIQLMIVPIGQKTWKEKGDKLVKKLVGIKERPKETALDKAVQAPMKALEAVGGELLGGGAEVKKKEEGPEYLRMLALSPGEVNTVKAIEQKLTKIGYLAKLRSIYIAKKEVFKKTRAAHPFIGSIKQFNTVNLNSLKPELSKTGTSGGIILFKPQRLAHRKNILLAAYRDRDPTVPMSPYVFNTEELASLWHFPSIDIKAPLVKKTEAKKSEPPMMLPIEPDKPVEERYAPAPEPDSGEEGETPTNLPFV